MKSSHTITIWLLDRLGLDVALTGDLLEERERGRSSIWYWRQVLIAAWTGTWGAIRDHKALALRAVATGFATEFLFIFLWNHLGPDLSMFSIALRIVNFSTILVTQTATGWIVARTHRGRRTPMVLLFLTCALFVWLCCTFSAARLMLVGSIHEPAYRPYLAWYLLTIFLSTAGILLGGILGASPKRSAHEITR